MPKKHAINANTIHPYHLHPVYNFLSYHCLSSPSFAFISTLSSVSIPESTSEALSHPDWK